MSSELKNPWFDWQRLTRIWFTGIALPSGLWLLLFLCLPLFFILIMSLGWKLGDSVFAFNWNASALVRAVQSPYREIYLLSTLMTLVATLLCLAAAFPICLLLSQLRSGLARPLLVVMMLPFLINFLVRVYGWFVLLRPDGLISLGLRAFGYHNSLISSWQGMLLGLVYGYLPFMILPIWSGLEKLDRRWIEAAQDLGASFRTIFFRIILPHCLPAILAGCLLVAVPMMGEYCIPKMLGGGLFPTVGLAIENQFLGGVQPDWNFGAALACLLLLGLTLLLLLARKSIVRAAIEPTGSPQSMGDSSI